MPVRQIKRFLLSRKTVLFELVLLLAFFVAAYFVPQRFSTPVPEFIHWQNENPTFSQWVKLLGGDHVYTSPIFAFLLFMSTCSLLLSSFEQVKIAYRKTFGRTGFESDSKPNEYFQCDPEQMKDLANSIKKEWYFPILRHDECIRFVKHPWGYWGNVLLHIGMMMVIGSSLVIVLTQQRGVIKLYEGEIFTQGSNWGLEEHGLLASRLELPASVRLDSVTPEFWDNDDLKQLTTELSFISPDFEINERLIMINQILKYKGVRVYQQAFGNAFFLEFFENGSVINRSALFINHPVHKKEPSYGELYIEQIPYTFKAKYFADVRKNTLAGRNPLLVLRLVDFDRTVGEVELKTGETKSLGDFFVRLVKVSRWGELIFTVMPGMWGIYLSFIILVIGPVLNYFTPPREFVVRKAHGSLEIYWKGTKFEKLYREEYEKMVYRYSTIQNPKRTI